jgi:hypothetical protein
MNLKAKNFIEAIKTAECSTEVLDLWSKAAKNSELSIKDLQDMHKACGSILLEAIQKNYEEKEVKDEESQEDQD